MQTLSQKDTRWTRTRLGFGTGTIGQYGCTITALSSLIGLTPDYVNEQLKKVNGFAGETKNLVIWSALPTAFPQIIKATRVKGYNNTAVLEAVTKFGGCLVEVDAEPIGAPRSSHWILYIGNSQCIDPWTGSVRHVDTYPKPLGYAVIEIIKEDVMSEDVEALLKKYGCESVAALDKKIYEHVGITWGDPSRNEDGGHLASERRTVKDLEKYRTFPEEVGTILGTTADISVIKVSIQKLVEEESVKDTVKKSAEDVKASLLGKVAEVKEEVQRATEVVGEAKDSVSSLNISTKAIEKLIREKVEQSEKTYSFFHNLFTYIGGLWRKQ